MLHPLVKRGKSNVSGIGLRAQAFIPAGTVIWHPCDRCHVIDERSFNRLTVDAKVHADEFGYRLCDNSILFPCSDAHLLNHSCDANVLDQCLDFGIAVRDISAGDELFCDYASFGFDPAWQFTCNCRSSECRGTIVSPGLNSRAQSDHPLKVRAALIRLSQVEQPLECSLARSSRVYSALRRELDPDVVKTSITDGPIIRDLGVR